MIILRYFFGYLHDHSKPVYFSSLLLSAFKTILLSTNFVTSLSLLFSVRYRVQNFFLHTVHPISPYYRLQSLFAQSTTCPSQSSFGDHPSNYIRLLKKIVLECLYRCFLRSLVWLSTVGPYIIRRTFLSNAISLDSSVFFFFSARAVWTNGSYCGARTYLFSGL